ncbi:MAG TPA: transposase [Solirubrobacteraceae bacterium]|jgi:transposase-like protein|nr:transposase [Solirubrobacteraceae bacterium]
MRKRYTGEQRRALVDLVTDGRATVSEAAARLGVTASTAYLWVKQAAAAAPRRRGAEKRDPSRSGAQLVPPTFVQLVRDGDVAAPIAVRVGNAEVQVRRGFDADLLRAVVQALEGGAA